MTDFDAMTQAWPPALRVAARALRDYDLRCMGRHSPWWVANRAFAVCNALDDAGLLAGDAMAGRLPLDVSQNPLWSEVLESPQEGQVPP